MDKYVPLFPDGFLHAVALGYIDKDDPPSGNLCLICGALVGSRWLHDIHHGEQDEENNERQPG